MSICPHCQSPISSEISKYGGECSNCFAFIQVDLGEDKDFEPTGMFTADQFASEEDEDTGEIELSELEVEVLDDDETTEILEPTDPIVDVDDTDVLNNMQDEEPTMALVSRDISTFKRDDDSVSQDLDDVLHQNVSELEKAISQVPSIQFSNEKVADTDDRNFVYEEDSDESFLGDTKPFKRKEVFVSKEEIKEIPQKKNQKKGIGLSLIGALIVVVVGGLWLANDKPIEEDESTGQENLYVPNMPEVSKVEKQKTPEKSVTQSSKSTKKNKATKPVQRGGIQTFQTAAPVSRAKTPTASASVSSSDKVKKDISKLRRNLKSCHDQALKIDPLASGKWRVQFKVNPSGKSSNISIKNLRAKNSDIESCMSRRIGRFIFHGPSSTTPYDFRIVFGG